jgi:hypothetical protein
VLASLSAGTNAYMRALKLANHLKPALAVSRCCVLPFYFFYLSVKYNHFLIIELLYQG